MPLQNRVTPFGEVVAIDQRGLFIGNRGIIHDPATRRLLTRRWATKAWLICRLDYKGIRRKVLAEHSWTELFFYDEATALAAGHRPCFLCRRESAEAFRAAWARGNRVPPPSAPGLDEVLHRERLQSGRRKLCRLQAALDELPDGAMVAAGSDAFLVAGGSAYHWSGDGYRLAANLPQVDGIITPPATLAALSAGYRPIVHPDVEVLADHAA